jgi:hypothetical protein
MSAASRREQQLAVGGVYHPRQQVEVNENGVWIPAQIQNVANFTVRNSITRGETNKPPNQVFAIGGEPNSTGENTHYMPGSQILFQGPHRWIKLLGTLISKNYVVQIDGRTETVPHTRIRLVARQARAEAQPQSATQPQSAAQPQSATQPQADGNYNRGQLVEVNENGRWRLGQVNDVYDYTIRNTATGRNLNKGVEQVRTEGENTNIMPGDRVQFQQGRNWLPGTLVSKNYIVVLDGTRYENVPHTRLRLAPVMPRTMTDEEFNRRWQEMRRQTNPGFDGNNIDDEDDDEDEGEDEDGAPRAAARPQGLAFEVHNAFADLDLPKFMTIIRRENNGSTNFKDNNNILEPVVSYINSQDTALTSEQKTRYINNIRNSIRQNVNAYIRDHPEVKDNTLEVIQFVLSQDPKYKDLYIETFENECMGGYSRGNKQSCIKGMFERIYMANKGTIEGLCFEELQGGTAEASSCKPIYLELHSAFTPGADIDINDIFQKWYNQFSYDAVPEEENILKNLSVEARKQHYRDFVRQDEAISERIWNNRDFQRKLEESIQKNNIIFETLTLDVGLGRKRRNRRTVKKKKKQKQRKATMRRLKRKTKGRY